MEPGERYCPIGHGVTGGVRGVRRGILKRTPHAKRHLLGVTVNDTYVINGYLGAGGFGAVYRAEQKPLGRDVALKLLMLEAADETVVNRFKREAQTAAALLDPNIVTLFDYGEANFSENEEDRVLYFAMELVYGPTLRRVIKAEGGLSLDASLKYGVNILRGLAAAHQLGVVHRDLKPGNVLIDESKNRKYFARLFDFGIASLQGSGGQTMQMAQGGVLGTPKYMAPEQWRAQQTAPSTDIYAFGVMMVEMLMGQPPVPKMEMVDMAAAHCRAPRPHLTHTAKGEPLPPALTNFIKKCMAIEMRQRYTIAGEALTVLEEIDRDRDRASIPTISHFVPHEARDDGDLSESTQMPAMGPHLGEGPRPAPLMGTPPPFPGAPQPKGPRAVNFSARQASEGRDESEVIKVELEEPRPRRVIWPWFVGGAVLILSAALFQLINVLSERLAAPPVQIIQAAPPPMPQPPVVAAPSQPSVIEPISPPPTMDAGLVADAAPMPDASPKPKPKPKPVKRRVEPKAPAPKETPATPSEPTTPTASPAAQAKAEAEYARGRDAENRGAPKSAQRFYMKALKHGLEGAKAVDARERIKRIIDETTLEAKQF
ncbi:protein kinase [Myxococcota bacterium]|nr:protein kinase [Myxococcota bacterium]MBU1432770.1 protein kinase [Myxococcota bacterium]MBU1897741.1 protein kinase [Myxococcota bacterium]